MGGRRGKGRNSLAVERKKRERERPTDRRMRPAEVYNWEEQLGLCFSGRGLTINRWAAKYCPLPRSSLPFRDIRRFRQCTLPAPLALSVSGRLRANREFLRGNLNTQSALKKTSQSICRHRSD